MAKDKRGRVMCSCTGYWFPHRKGGGACEFSPTRNIHLARRRGDPGDMLEALADHAWDNPGTPSSGDCPF